MASGQDPGRVEFLIGSSKFVEGTGESLKELGKKFITRTYGQIVLLACHAGGNGINGGEKLIENLSCTTGTTVYGCRSWTGAYGLFLNQNVSLKDPRDPVDPDYESAEELLGQWNKSTNGTPAITLKEGIAINIQGNVREIGVNVNPRVNRIVRKIKKWFD